MSNNVDIKNASPMVYDLGTEDKSGRTVPTAVLDFPQHIPKFYIFGEKGQVGPQYVRFSEATLTDLYGDATFDVDGKYYTHQTPFLELCAKNANNCVVHRLIPNDAKDVANIAMYLDVLPVQVPVYEKTSSGSIRLDNDNNPVPMMSGGAPVTVAGYRVCYVLDHVVENLGDYQPGELTIRPGIQSEGAVQSQQYPIREVTCSTPGEYGNKIAFRVFAASKTDSIDFPNSYLSEAKVYPYYFQLLTLSDPATGKTEVTPNAFGAQFSRFSSKPISKDPNTGLRIDFEKVIETQYINSTLTAKTDLGRVVSYNANILTLLTMFYNAEKAVVDVHRDSAISTTENNFHAFNMVSFTNSNNSPYNAVKLVDVAGSVRLTRNTNIFLKGGSDGTISETLMDELVAEDMSRYADATHPYNDHVAYPESVIYDSGFAMNTKKALAKFISRRKNTNVVPATYAHNSPDYLLADQYSSGIALKTAFELYPESETFGTGPVRSTVIVGSGTIINHSYQKRVPLTYELLHMASRFMGASNGKWRNGFAFDRAPRNVLTQLKDVDVTWVPSATRQAMWSAGLNFALNYKEKSQFFPALQTVYEDDTSILNSFFAAVAIAYVNKVNHAAWREFSGSVSLTAAQLEEEVNKFVAANTRDKFDGMFVIVPDCKVTEYDALRGYSFTLTTKVYGNPMTTVMVTSTQAFRMSDLQA